MVRYWHCYKNPPNISVNLGQPWKSSTHVRKRLMIAANVRKVMYIDSFDDEVHEGYSQI